MVVLRMPKLVIICHLHDWLVATESIGKAPDSQILNQGHTITKLMELAETAI